MITVQNFVGVKKSHLAPLAICFPASPVNVPQSPPAHSPSCLMAGARDDLREQEGNDTFLKLFVE